ncbi:hypothetical protein ASwh1_62 [Aeromonas phage Aswh_1]|nr:hypothetical protein ASwh1_62 [Aeromonas phage Aswh_1]
MNLNYIYADQKRIMTNVKYKFDYTEYPWRTFFEEKGQYWLIVYMKDGEIYSMQVTNRDVSRDSMYFGFECDNYVSEYPAVYLFDVTKMDETLKP